jgi:hypothetical protein
MVEFFAGPAAIGDFSVFGRPADALRALARSRFFSVCSLPSCSIPLPKRDPQLRSKFQNKRRKFREVKRASFFLSKQLETALFKKVDVTYYT